MRPGGGRSVAMISGFLGDRPAERLVIGVLKLRGATSPVLHHPTARFALVPTLSRGGGELDSVKMVKAMGAGGIDAHGSWFSGGQTCQKPADWGFETSTGCQAGTSPPQRSLCTGSHLFSGRRGA